MPSGGSTTNLPPSRSTVGTIAETNGTNSWLPSGRSTASTGDAGGCMTSVTVPSTVPDDPEEFYDHQLVGLTVVDQAGTVLGTVFEVMHPPASPVLAVDRPDGTQELVPFVSAIVPTVDLDGGKLVVDPPDGMFAT